LLLVVATWTVAVILDMSSPPKKARRLNDRGQQPAVFSLDWLNWLK